MRMGLDNPVKVCYSGGTMIRCENGHIIKLPVIVGKIKPLVCWKCEIGK